MDSSLPGSSVHGIPKQEYWSGLPFPAAAAAAAKAYPIVNMTFIKFSFIPCGSAIYFLWRPWLETDLSKNFTKPEG